MDDYRNSPTSKFCANVFPAHSCPFYDKVFFLSSITITRKRELVKPLLFFKAYFPANEIDCMYKVKEK